MSAIIVTTIVLAPIGLGLFAGLAGIVWFARVLQGESR